ncbi:MAG: 16S rRNA (cytosine(1402)-N(4))-methyltransferase RsmH [Anaerolineae bacterium]|nr:16S rRNA (cytosine(1402)-N(4))-methyltransferase RsmH [Anaerolineae bacterium]
MDGLEEHIPVLAEEVLAGLEVQPGGRYIDATLGAGGHAESILQHSAPDGKLLGLDADPDAVSFARERLRSFADRASLRVGNFRHLNTVATVEGFEQVDGILMDLGLSSRQLADAQRGFSFSQEGPLDMRMNPAVGRTAADLVNSLSESELARILWEYGEERHSRRIARTVVAHRPLRTTGQLADLVARTIGRREKIHPATRTFQALRIAVNQELVALDKALPQARDLLRPGGRLAVIAFHSLEDRLVKRFYQHESRDCICPPEAPFCVCGHQATLRVITRKPIRPTRAEVEQNPQSRSARLRVAERLPASR